MNRAKDIAGGLVFMAFIYVLATARSHPRVIYIGPYFGIKPKGQ